MANETNGGNGASNASGNGKNGGKVGILENTIADG